jgi:serine protease
MKIKIVCLSVLASSILAACGGATDNSTTPQSSVKVQNSSAQLKSTAKAASNEIPAQYASHASVIGMIEGAEYDRFIVYYKKNNLLKGSNDGDAVAASNNARVASARRLSIQERHITGTKGHVIQASRGMSASEAQAFMVEYLKDADVEYIEPDLILHPTLVPNDTRFNEQWDLSNGPAGMSMPNAWDKATGKNIVVAVVDTGITSHSELEGQVLPGYNFISDSRWDRNRSGRSSDASDPGDWLQDDDYCPISAGPQYVHDSSWHGTHVAGTIAAKTNNSSGVAGIAFNAKIVPVRALGRCGGFMSDINDGIIWASGGTVPGIPNNPNPAKVINLSLSGSGLCSKTAQDAIDIARNNGAIVVQAAGNENLDASKNASNPACQGEIVVGATDSSGNRAGFSNYGSLVNVMAPGDSILSTWNKGPKGPEGESYTYMSGTSMATPHVSGLVALMLEKDSTLTVDQIKRYITSTATSMNSRCPEGCGAGLVNAEKALSSLPIQVAGDLPQSSDEVVVKVDPQNGSIYRIEIPEKTEFLRMVTADASAASIRSEFDTEWKDCRPEFWPAWKDCDAWDPKPGFYYIKMNANSGTTPRVSSHIYINAGHLNYGETIDIVAKAPYFPRVVTLDKIGANEAVQHTLNNWEAVYAVVNQYSGKGGLFENNENADLFRGDDGIYGGAWMLVGPRGTGVGVAASKPDADRIKVVLPIGGDQGKDAHYSYTPTKVAR